MKLVPISSISIPPTRQRREFEPAAMMDLMESIRLRGLLHPVVLREGTTLVAGERRLRAIRDLHLLKQSFKFGGEPVAPDMVPCVDLGDLSPLEALEAELDENIKRKDITWQERAEAVARIAEIRGQQATLVGAPAPTVAEIAEEVRGSSRGSSQDYTRKELILAKHLDNPEVAKAKSVEEAFKALKRQETAKQNAKLAELYGNRFTSTTHTLRLGDAAEVLHSLPEASFDCLITDPPYGMSADTFGDSDGRASGAHGYTDDAKALDSAIQIIYTHAHCLLKPAAHLYIFCDIDGFFAWRDALSAGDFQVHRTPLVWHKPNGSRMPWPEMGPQRKYELICYAVRGKRPVTKIAGDVISVPTDENLGHAAQKPVELYRELLSRSVQPGDSVLDCFCGSGPVFPAAHALKVQATGVERDATFYGIAVKRIKELT